MSLLYAMRLNMALGQLGVDPRIVNQIHRDAARHIGLSSGQTAQEVALLILTQLPAEFQHRANIAAIRKWIGAGKVRPDHQIIGEALQSLSFYIPDLSWSDLNCPADERE
jgi:hypothetical protein